jgi:hypothetical protein
VQDEDVIAEVHGQADRGAEDPVVRQRLGPVGINLEHRRPRAGLRLCGNAATDVRRAEVRETRQQDERKTRPYDQAV